MTTGTFRADPELHLPDPPKLPPPLRTTTIPPSGGGGRTGAGQRFAIAGERAVVKGGARDDPASLFVHVGAARSLPVFRKLALSSPGGHAIPEDAGPSSRPRPPLLPAPGLVRRELDRGGGRTLVETCFVPRRLPGAVLEWRVADGERPGAPSSPDARPELPAERLPAELLLAWEVPTPPGRYVQRGPFLRLLSDAGEERLFLLDGDPLASWTIRERTSALDVAVRLQLPTGGLARLCVLAGSEGEVRDALATLPHLEAHERRRLAEPSEAREELLFATASIAPATVSSTLPDAAESRELASALARAHAELDAAWIRPGHAARTRRRAGGGGGGGMSGVVVRGYEPGPPFAPLTGRDAALAGVAALALGRFGLAETLLECLAGEVERGRAAEAHRTLAEAYTLWTGRTPRSPRRPPALPVVGQPGRGAGSVPANTRGPEARSLAGDGVAGAAELDWPGRAFFLAGDPEGGLRAWVAHLDAGAAGGTGSALHAAAGVLPFVLGILGTQPEAPYGRLRLAPFPPAAWSSLDVRNLRAGDARIDLRYRKQGPHHTFTLRQTSGRAPVNLVFEPAVSPSGVPMTVRLAGEVVDVGRFERGDRGGIRLQLPLDDERRVSIEEGTEPSD